MAKPRIFVSSTYYDLKHVRNGLEAFIDAMGYDSVMFENGDIAFHHENPLDQSCYNEISNCQMLVLIIGGRYGSPASDQYDKNSQNQTEENYNSITKKEYETARRKDIPIFLFVEKNVLAEHKTYKENIGNKTIKFAHVDSPNVFRLLDDILEQKRNNFIKDFEKIDDIIAWLRTQWAGLFADFLMKGSAESNFKDLSIQIADLRETSSVLKNYTETMIRKLEPKQAPLLIQNEELKRKVSKGLRIIKEPLMHFLQELFSIQFDPAKVYDQLQMSDDISVFLKEAGVLPDEMMKKLAEYESFIIHDFLHLKKRYIKDIGETLSSGSDVLPPVSNN